MTDLQLVKRSKNNGDVRWNESHSSSYIRESTIKCNNNNEEPKYLHKKFKKMATKEITSTFKTKFKTDTRISVEPVELSIKGILPNLDNLSSHLEGSTHVSKSYYTCSNCKLSPAKLSILQKHIETNPNERPSTRVPCRFSLETKPNVCKYCQSKTHVLKVENADTMKVIKFFFISIIYFFKIKIFNKLNIFFKLSKNLDVNLSNSLVETNDTETASLSISPTSTHSQSVLSQVHSSDSTSILGLQIDSNFAFNTEHSCKCTSRASSSNKSDNNSISSKIYKPKFHTFLQQGKAIQWAESQNSSKKFKEHIRNMIKNKNVVQVSNADPPNHLTRQQSLQPKLQSSISRSLTIPPRKRCFSENIDKSVSYFSQDVTCSSSKNEETYQRFEWKPQSDVTINLRAKNQNRHTTEFNSKSLMDIDENLYKIIQPVVSPGPVLGNTQLVDSEFSQFKFKRTRYESSSNTESLNKVSKLSRAKTLQMFGGEVQVLDQVTGNNMKLLDMCSNSSTINVTDTQLQSCSETSVLVRSGLHSGGIIMHKAEMEIKEPRLRPDAPVDVGLSYLVPNIAPPTLAPTVSCISCFKPRKILHNGQLIPYVPGIPGPHNLPISIEPLDLAFTATESFEFHKFKYNKEIPCTSLNSSSDVDSYKSINNAICLSEKVVDTVGNKFLRPSSLSLKPGTFTPKQHHGITPSVNTLPLISPETPRSKKSYGQFYLNGHAYTYLGLKCSTRLFYCTLNRPQPMYAMQQNSLSMYSNWKICLDESTEYELAGYDSRQKSSTFTLASSQQNDILTHSSHILSNINNPSDYPAENAQTKNKCTKIFDGGFESNEDYTYVRGRGMIYILITFEVSSKNSSALSPFKNFPSVLSKIF